MTYRSPSEHFFMVKKLDLYLTRAGPVGLGLVWEIRICTSQVRSPGQDQVGTLFYLLRVW